jgi:hypothetical protein
MIFAGLAIGTMELNERTSVLEPFRLIARYARTATLLALTFVFFCAWVVALVNLAAAFGLGVWAASAIGGFDAPQWQLLFTGGNRRFILLLCAGAVVAVEPFWVAAQVVFVRKAGAQERGDDLRAWFEEFRSAATAVAALVLLLTAGSAAAAPRVTLHEYVAALETIDAQLATNQLAAAKDGARALTGADVVWSKGTFKTDAAMLGAIVNASRAEGPHRTRLVVAIGELRRAGGMETARADRKALEQIAAEQEPPALPAGGELKLEMEGDLSLFERILESIGDALEWIAKKLRQFIDWLRDLLPRSRRGDSSMTPGLRWIVIGVVSLIVLLIIVLAINVLRRSRAAAEEPQTSAPIGSKRDEDPLSRGATEWERYAADLAAAGRHREAIRAWYHAVLVTCYAAGILHFRKGRTNWEYIALLAPSLEWRAELITLTRRFEQEWYGHDESSIDALTDCSENAQSILDSIRGEMRGAA